MPNWLRTPTELVATVWMLINTSATPRPPARVVILGARGFISRHLQAWCARSNVALLTLGSDAVDLTDTKNSLQLARLLRSDDAVIMTSMLTPEKGRDFRALMSNLRMAETVCLALQQAACSHFVYLSSDAVYDAHQTPLDEDSSREPTDLYALSHSAREMMLSSELEKKKIPFCILRLTSIYGTEDTHNTYGPNRFVRSALRDGCIQVLGRGEERRSHVFIQDLVRLVGLVLQHCSSGTLNVAVRPAASFGEIAEIVVRLIGRPIRVEYAPRTLSVVHRPYKATQVFRFLYNLGRPIGPIVHRTFLNSAVFKSFPGFDFTPLEEGLASFISAEVRAIGLSPNTGAARDLVDATYPRN